MNSKITKQVIVPIVLEKSLKQLEQIDLYALDKQKPAVSVKNNNT
jgi:hypothetical protein